VECGQGENSLAWKPPEQNCCTDSSHCCHHPCDDKEQQEKHNVSMRAIMGDKENLGKWWQFFQSSGKQLLINKTKNLFSLTLVHVKLTFYNKKLSLFFCPSVCVSI